MASEGPRIVGVETEEEKKRKAQAESNHANGNINKAITKDLLNDFLQSEEFKSKNDTGGEFGLLPMHSDYGVCNLTYFPKDKSHYKSIIVTLIPPDNNDPDQKNKSKTLQVETSAEDEDSLTMMIFTLAQSLKKFNPNSLEVILEPKDDRARKIMEAACIKYGLKVVKSFSAEKKNPAPGATLKMDKPDSTEEVSRPRLAGK